MTSAQTQRPSAEASPGPSTGFLGLATSLGGHQRRNILGRQSGCECQAHGKGPCDPKGLGSLPGEPDNVPGCPSHLWGPLPSLGTPPPEEMAQCSRSAQWAKRTTPQRGALTSLQGGQWFRLFAELAVPNVIGRLHSELVGREGLEPAWGERVNERRFLHRLC